MIEFIIFLLIAPFVWHIFKRGSSLVSLWLDVEKLTILQKVFSLLTTGLIFFYIGLICEVAEASGYGIEIFLFPVLFIPLSILLELLFLPFRQLRVQKKQMEYGGNKVISEAKKLLEGEANKYLYMEYADLNDLVDDVHECDIKSLSGNIYYVQIFLTHEQGNKNIIRLKAIISKDDGPILYEYEVQKAEGQTS